MSVCAAWCSLVQQLRPAVVVLHWRPAGQDAWENLALNVLVWSVFGTPFSRKKSSGGLEVDWSGDWLGVGRFS